MTKRSIIKALSVVPKLNQTERVDFLRVIGFTPFKVKNPYCEIYKNEDLQMVVKNGFFFGVAPKHIKVATVLLDKEHDFDHSNRVWVRQPLVNTENPAKALEQVKARLAKRKRKSFVDVHRWNVGHIKKNGRWKAVVFDW